MDVHLIIELSNIVRINVCVGLYRGIDVLRH